MVGIFYYYPKSFDKDAKFPKTIKDFLESDERIVVANCHFHHLNYIDGGAMEKMSDLDLIEELRKRGHTAEGQFKKSKSGYVNEDKTTYIRIIRQPKEWFKTIPGIN